MKRLKKALKGIERRWVRPLFRHEKRHRRPLPTSGAVSPGVEALLVALLRAEVRRREAGERESTPLAIRYEAASGADDLEAMAMSMLSLPSESLRATA
jgi:hypothetical protein